ncbi:stage III sporulation protein AC [Syntrophobotulus glycolicus DSM 8271]|jgi:stage III sporulation protein AC|uniref:Stage III sporulation protein AC n=1 Tax=Syntrophobotulus glycolicus (strain DSM 8271 / FlGlyR) TaxID=645991 RepID=F0T0S2_SYNGF|nr:stage III sporulation protein AC [Syntrophobotulus glycolicus]ADY56211.1 stage III sporulation protein AC [Syntrophobotulus glycolicus DSM 8271]
MNFDLVFKAAGVGLIVGILVLILEQYNKKEQAQLVTIAGVIVVLYIVLQSLSDLMVLVKSVFKLY